VPEIKVKKMKVLTGPNIWAYRPVLEILADIGKFESLPSNKLPGFTEHLVEVIPTLWEHRCSEGRPGGFLERLRLGTYMGHTIEHIILELQSLAGMDVGFGRTRGTGHYGEYRIVVDYKDAEAAKTCADLAIEIAETLGEGRHLEFSLAERIAEVRAVAEDNMLGPSTQAIVDAARARGIPWFRLNSGALVQLGQGRYARRIQASETSNTSNIGVEIAQDKELTKDLLARVGAPVPQGAVVSEADEAWQAAEDIGLPVVLKPYDGNQGKAVSVNLTTEEQVRAAFELAHEYSRRVIVEQYLSGSDYRLLVVNGKLVAAAERCPAQVVGDGLHNVRDLVRMVNEDPRRGHGHGAALTRIRIDAAAALALAKQGYSWDNVPPPGQVVFLRDNSNLSTGGTATDVTDVVHPDNAAIAVLAAKTIGLDVAGVDVVCDNIKRPLDEQGGGIVEVNAAPGLRMHVYPSEGRPRPVGEAIVELLFPNNAPARVPVMAITGTNGKTTVTRAVAHIFATMKQYVGMTTTDGIYLDGVRRVKGDCAGPRSAESVLMHPQVEVAVLETARGGILRSGLAFDRCQIGAVLNVASDHLGLEGIETPERLARVKRVVIESVAKDGYGVLNADDPLTADMAEYCAGQVILFGMEALARPLALHLAGGGRAVFHREGDIILAEGPSETLLMHAVDVPSTHDGMVPFQVQNAMAAAAVAWGAGVPLDSIRLGLRTFQTDDVTAPGRFNMFDVAGATVIVDYGHNPHAVKAVQQAITLMKPRRKIGVVAAPGDRRDADIQELAVIAANTFDWVVVREDDDLRGRERGEVAELISATISRTRPSLPLRVTLDEGTAVREALDMARPGDAVVLFIDKIDEMIALVKERARATVAGQSDAFWCPVPEAPARRRHATSDVPSIETILETTGLATEQYGGDGRGERAAGTGREGADRIARRQTLGDGEPDAHS
jgi:cyanophycin synthetase